MNVLRTTFFKSTGIGWILGTVTMMSIVLLLHGVPAKAQNKDGQPQTTETTATKLTETEAVFQRTETQNASRNIGDSTSENTGQSAATNIGSGAASGTGPIAAVPPQLGKLSQALLRLQCIRSQPPLNLRRPRRNRTSI